MYEKAYYCYGCKRTVPKEEKEKIPDCCGTAMALLPMNECVKPPASAENARFDDEDEPCDDGRAR
jgi:hypothetical protein